MKTALYLCSVLAVSALRAEPAAPAESPLLPCCRPEIPADAPLSAASLYQIEVDFTDDAGQPFSLVALRGRPVALTMFFASCTTACPATVADLARIRERLPAGIREQAVIVMVSFDTQRDTAEALRGFRESRALDENWVLLRGTDDAVRELAAILGVKFRLEADGQFAHSNLITILSPEGEIVHQRAGLTGGLDEAAGALARSVQPSGA